MKNLFKYLIIIFVATLFSCETEEGYEDYTLERSKAVEISGDWFVQTFVGTTMVLDYSLITTSNTSVDDGTMIQIFDHQNIWWFNAQSPVDLNVLTFSGNDLASAVGSYEITVSITNGLIEKGSTVTSDTNQVADSISFDIEFSDDPGTIYHIEGFRRSGFLEDEH